MPRKELHPDELVRVTSHRAREKLERLLGYPPKGYFSWQRAGSWREVPADKRAAALAIKGIKPAGRKVDDLREYISFG